jgi:hypothetical protein
MIQLKLKWYEFLIRFYNEKYYKTGKLKYSDKKLYYMRRYSHLKKKIALLASIH